MTELLSKSKRCRICMVVHGCYPSDARVRREAMAAVAAGHGVDVICTRRPGEKARETIDGVGVHRLPVAHVSGRGASTMVREYALFALLATLRLIPAAFRRRYDVIHVHNPPDFLIMVALVPRLLGTRVILDVHDLSAHMFRARFSGPMAGPIGVLLDRIELRACRLAHVVLTVHEPYRAELVAHGVAPEKISVVMNSADQSLVSQVQRQHRSDAFVVGYSGTITPWYGVDLIIEALARLASDLPSAQALIMGDGDALGDLKDRVQTLGLSRRVEFSGEWLPAEVALGRLACSSCGVIPNRPTELNRFALSTKLFEYVALGLPVVVARLPTLAAHFSEDEVTFFEPGDPDSLAQALRWVAQNPAAAASKTQRAQQRVARQYSWSANRERYLQALDREATAPQAKASLLEV